MDDTWETIDLDASLYSEHYDGDGESCPSDASLNDSKLDNDDTLEESTLGISTLWDEGDNKGRSEGRPGFLMSRTTSSLTSLVGGGGPADPCRTPPCAPLESPSPSVTTSRMTTTMTTSVSQLSTFESDRLTNRLKNTNLEKFHTMCKMHLSFLLDLPGSSLDEFLNDGYRGPACLPMTPVADKASGLWHLNFGKKKKVVKDIKSEVGITHEFVENILPLIEFLGKEENVRQEGLFRKNGHIGRQKLLREKLVSGEDIQLELDSGIYSAHDSASVLKVYLSELTEPVLTEKHYMAHCQVPEMVLETKQLQTVQLLVQLLPSENFFLLHCLLELLNRVSNVEGNKMTAETLGMLFAPHILVPRKMAASELQAVAGNITKTAAFMIEKGPELFVVPDPLVRDIATYWQQMEESSDDRGSGKSEDESESLRTRYKKRVTTADLAINTNVSFADRQASQQAAAKTDTQVALAHLYAHVSSMPDSSKKRRLLKQFNKANGLGTPASGMHDKHKRTKSLGDSLKKIVHRNHRRRDSGHSVQVHSVTSQDTPRHIHHKCVDSPLAGATVENTPVIKRPSMEAVSPDATTPVMQLFKTETIRSYPSNSRVHIVDMKENKEPACVAAMMSKSLSASCRKRKEPDDRDDAGITNPDGRTTDPVKGSSRSESHLASARHNNNKHNTASPSAASQRESRRRRSRSATSQPNNNNNATDPRATIINDKEATLQVAMQPIDCSEWSPKKLKSTHGALRATWLAPDADGSIASSARKSRGRSRTCGDDVRGGTSPSTAPPDTEERVVKRSSSLRRLLDALKLQKPDRTRTRTSGAESAGRRNQDGGGPASVAEESRRESRPTHAAHVIETRRRRRQRVTSSPAAAITHVEPTSRDTPKSSRSQPGDPGGRRAERAAAAIPSVPRHGGSDVTLASASRPARSDPFPVRATRPGPGGPDRTPAPAPVPVRPQQQQSRGQDPALVPAPAPARHGAQPTRTCSTYLQKLKAKQREVQHDILPTPIWMERHNVIYDRNLK